MAITLKDFQQARLHALTVHAPWKQQINLADLIANDKWEIIWADDSAEDSDPLIENLYSEALEDKILTASAGLPQLFTMPARGTRKDRAERNAESRKRAALAMWERSELRRNSRKIYRDYYHAGAMAGIPWTDWSQPAASRFPFFLIINPRQVFPLGYDSKGRLTSGLVLRQKRMTEMEADWGFDHPSLVGIREAHRTLNGSDANLEWVEEDWFFDGTQWAVAVSNSQLPGDWQGSPFAPGTVTPAGQGVDMRWLHAPENHRLASCPLKFVPRITVDDQPRGALMDIIPQLKVAQNFMARLLDDLDAAIYAPTVLDNIENSHEFGFGAVLLGDGTGAANIIRDRPTVNFEAQSTVRDILEGVRRQAFEPQQRSGDPGASISSAKGTNALMGTFNAELAASQQDFEEFITQMTAAGANFDEVWCPGRKEIWGVDQTNQEFSETYDPVSVYHGDYRFKVSYGDRTGLDEQNHLIRLATMKNLQGMSTRSFIVKAGITDDVLQEERDMAIENLTNLFINAVLPQTIQAGDLTALKKFVDKIDDDAMTVRQAVLESIEELSSVPAGDGSQSQSSQRADILRMARSLDRGGIPGNAEGQPPSQTPGFAPAVRRGLAAIGPGGN